MNFIYIDIPFLIVFAIIIAIFLYKKRKKIEREWIFYLYKTKIGINFMNKVSKKYPKTLGILAYISITFGYLAIVAVFAILIYTITLLIKIPALRKIPQVVPFLPYAPQLFKLPVPEFIFIHWIIIIIILAVTHEFAHGIFSRLYKIKIKSTGFGFLGPILTAFVEPNEKEMAKKKKKEQLAILSAGSFSNFTFGIIFAIIFLIFLYLSLAPTTILYAGSTVNVSDVKNISLDGKFLNTSDLSTINNLESNQRIIFETKNQTYLLDKELFIEQKDILKKLNNNSNSTIVAYYNSSAINTNLQGEILSINNINIKNLIIFEELSNMTPGQEVTVETTENNYTLLAKEHPSNSSKGFIGLAHTETSKNILAKIFAFLSPTKNPFMQYTPKYNSDIFRFITIFFFWLLTACFGVALFNMMPVGFLDGGKFFLITALGITKSEKVAKILYRIFSYIIGLIFVFLILAPIF